LIVTRTDLPLFLFVTRTRESQRRDRWAAVSALSFNGPPHATCVPLPLSYVLAIPSSELAELASAVITMAMRIIIQSISWARHRSAVRVACGLRRACCGRARLRDQGPLGFRSQSHFRSASLVCGKPQLAQQSAQGLVPLARPRSRRWDAQQLVLFFFFSRTGVRVRSRADALSGTTVRFTARRPDEAFTKSRSGHPTSFPSARASSPRGGWLSRRAFFGTTLVN
jgi:hypothetical protein